MATLMGDVIIAAAFVSYQGFFDHFYRKVLLNSWKSFLKNNSHIQYKTDRSLIEFLSAPSERLHWQTHKLP
jgi:dynein heavy chain 1, cytosolic